MYTVNQGSLTKYICHRDASSVQMTNQTLNLYTVAVLIYVSYLLSTRTQSTTAYTNILFFFLFQKNYFSFIYCPLFIFALLF